MSTVSAVRKVGAVAKILGRQVQRTRTGSALLKGVMATAKSFGEVLHQLWLEVTGFTFLAVAGFGAMAGLREYAKLQAGQVTGHGRLILSICFTISFTWFGVSSFWRVRRRRKA